MLGWWSKLIQSGAQNVIARVVKAQTFCALVRKIPPVHKISTSHRKLLVRISVAL